MAMLHLVIGLLLKKQVWRNPQNGNNKEYTSGFLHTVYDKITAHTPITEKTTKWNLLDKFVHCTFHSNTRKKMNSTSYISVFTMTISKIYCHKRYKFTTCSYYSRECIISLCSWNTCSNKSIIIFPLFEDVFSFKAWHFGYIHSHRFTRRPTVTFISFWTCTYWTVIP